jgi:hypothetical protein
MHQIDATKQLPLGDAILADLFASLRHAGIESHDDLGIKPEFTQ